MDVSITSGSNNYRPSVYDAGMRVVYIGNKNNDNNNNNSDNT